MKKLIALLIIVSFVLSFSALAWGRKVTSTFALAVGKRNLTLSADGDSISQDLDADFGLAGELNFPITNNLDIQCDAILNLGTKGEYFASGYTMSFWPLCFSLLFYINPEQKEGLISCFGVGANMATFSDNKNSSFSPGFGGQVFYEGFFDPFFIKLGCISMSASSGDINFSSAGILFE